jgi:hypothetical protein
VRIVHCIALGIAIFLGTDGRAVRAQDDPFATSYSYVVNTRPPDDFLALRTQPFRRGVPITTMPNGTLLELLQRRADRWWYVRVLPFGHEGWALSGQGSRNWIECCRTGLTDPRPIPTPDEPVGFKTQSGNIHCQVDERVLRCDLKEMSTRPRRPRSCDLEWGDAFVIEQNGQSGYRLCHRDTVVNDELLPLSYGNSWSQEGYTCKSEQTGLTCMNSTSHGFSLSRGGQKVF